MNEEERAWVRTLERRSRRHGKSIEHLEQELRRIRMGLVVVAAILIIAVITACGASPSGSTSSGTEAPPTTSEWDRWTSLGRSTYFQCNGTTGVYIHDNFVQLLPLDPECAR